ncbi:MAG: hypothetical protein RR285_05740 [Acinetobacter sp.]
MKVDQGQLNAKLELLEERLMSADVIRRVLSDAEVQNWCGEGCRGDCKGGGFFD